MHFGVWQTCKRAYLCVCVCSDPLDALFVDTDAPEQGFKDLAECKGKEANGAEL